MTIHDVLRALVRGDAASLNSAQWVGQALATIDAHEAADRAVAAVDVAPAQEVTP